MSVMLHGSDPQRVIDVFIEATPVMWNRFPDGVRTMLEPSVVPDGVLVVVFPGTENGGPTGRAVLQVMADVLDDQSGGDPITVDVLCVPDDGWPYRTMADVPAVQAWSVTRTRRFDENYRPRSFPAWLVRDAVSWLRTADPTSPRLLASMGGVNLEIDWDSVGPTLELFLPQSRATVYGHDPRPGSSTAPVAWLDGATYPNSGLQFASPDHADLAEAMVGLRQLLRSRADQVVWSGVRAVPAAQDLRSTVTTSPDVRLLLPRGHRARSDWNRRTKAGGPSFTGDLADRSVPEAMWTQIIGPGHLERLGGVLPPGATQVGEERWEVTFGDPTDWIGRKPNAKLIRRAYAVLGPLVLSAGERSILWQSHFDNAPISRNPHDQWATNREQPH